MSENAVRVMAAEGMTEAHNIARFFAHRVPVRQGDVLVVDEASQVSTADLAWIVNLTAMCPEGGHRDMVLAELPFIVTAASVSGKAGMCAPPGRGRKVVEC